MNRLIEDKVVRVAGQAIVLSCLVILAGLALVFDVFVLLERFGRLETSWNMAALLLFAVLRVPFEEDFAPLIVIVGALVPVVFSAVCFGVDGTTTPPSVTNRLNGVGHFALVLMLIGVVSGGVGILLFSIMPGVITGLASGEDNRAAVQGLLTAIVSFQAMYFAQLLGLTPK